MVVLEAVATLTVVVVFCAYLVSWWHGYHDALTDPNLQTDDARTALFAFHRYDKGAPLADDPIANEMIEYQPYAFRLLYRITVPFVGLLAAAKIVQFVCLAIIVAAGIVLWRSRRAGLGTALLFVMLMFRDSYVMNRVGGALPRSFGFPAMGLWFAGVIAHDIKARRAGAIVAALTYPSALAMVLAPEGIYALRRFGRHGFHTTWRRLRQYLVLVGVSAALFAPTAILGTKDGGPVHTLEQAEHEPAFSKAGRLWVLPLGDPGVNFGKQIASSFHTIGDSPLPRLQEALSERGGEVAMVCLGVLLILPLLGVTPVPAGALAFAAASLILYAISVVFAFRLYSPERYYSFGMHMLIVGLEASTLGLIMPNLKPRIRSIVRRFVAALAMFWFWSWLGTGATSRHPMAMTISYRSQAPLWRFIHSLPPSVRIASFIKDGDDIPLFTQRANNGGYETMQPWLTLSWARQKARAEDTIRAFYATSHHEVLAYAAKYGVTHLLVNRTRYREDFVKRSRTFEPLSRFARRLLSHRKLEDLVLREIPPEAVIFEYGSLELVDVDKLRRAWKNQS